MVAEVDAADVGDPAVDHRQLFMVPGEEMRPETAEGIGDFNADSMSAKIFGQAACGLPFPPKFLVSPVGRGVNETVADDKPGNLVNEYTPVRGSGVHEGAGDPES